MQSFAPALFKTLTEAEVLQFRHSAGQAFEASESEVECKAVFHPVYRHELALLLAQRAEAELATIGMEQEALLERGLQALSLARTALSDPGGLPESEDAKFTTERGDLVKSWSTLNAYAVDQIDTAMGLLDPEVDS